MPNTERHRVTIGPWRRNWEVIVANGHPDQAHTLGTITQNDDGEWEFRLWMRDCPSMPPLSEDDCRLITTALTKLRKGLDP
jgi:hypothetical protein